jgi:hypothetical protein
MRCRKFIVDIMIKIEEMEYRWLGVLARGGYRLMSVRFNRAMWSLVSQQGAMLCCCCTSTTS